MTLKKLHITHIMDRRSRNRQMLIDNDKTDNSYEITDKKKYMFSKKKLHKTPDRIRPGCLVGEQRRTESDKRIHRTKYRTKDMKKPQNSYLVKIGDHFSCSCTSRTQTDQQTEWWTITNHYNQSLQARRIASNPTRSLTPKVALNKKITTIPRKRFFNFSRLVKST